MIQINLAPVEELEDHLWFVPDLAAILLVGLMAWAIHAAVLSMFESDINGLQLETAALTAQTHRLKPETERYKELNQQILVLRSKITSLQKITISKVTRYKPVIVLEYLQNLRPNGLWFAQLEDDSEHSMVRLVGSAFDSLLIAEFITALEATGEMTVDASDLRTQIYFESVTLGRVSAGSQTDLGQTKKTNPESSQKLDEERGVLAKLKGNELAKQEEWDFSISKTLFPELGAYPSFSLKIRYSERKI